MAEEPKTKEAEESAPHVKTEQKVELDLDDAPFLDDEPEPEPEPEKEPEESEPAPAAAAAPAEPQGFLQRLLANKKKLIMAGGGALLLIIAAVVVNVFLFSSDPPPPPPPGPEPQKVDITPKPQPPAETPKFIMQFAPFWVQLKDTEGAVRFLSLRFSIPTESEILFAEMNMKVLILRDALFYYLRNQPIISLSDEKKATAFKADLMTVINEHVGSGKISEILIQDYLIQ